MREDVNSKILFQKYTLSEETAARLESIREMLKDDIAQANPLWKVIAGENEEEICSESENSDNEDESKHNESQMIHNQSIVPSTQFYFTQAERTIVETSETSIAALPQRSDILESACESLEKNNGRLDFAQLESLSSEDFILVVDEMTRKLSPKSIYNLCASMNDITIEQKIKYVNILCTHLLLPKIIEVEEPSRLLSSAIVECIKNFPDEIQQFIFVPLLNADLKDTMLITTIVNSFDLEKKAVLLEEFLVHVKELKSWHICILQNFLSVRMDHNMTDKIVKLFSEKAFYYSKDKTFGKLILSFLKLNTALSQEQKNLMAEVVVVNETLFKKPMENILKNM